MIPRNLLGYSRNLVPPPYLDCTSSRTFPKSTNTFKPATRPSSQQIHPTRLTKHSSKPARTPSSSIQKDPSPHVIFAAGFKALGQRLESIAHPGSVTRFLIHFGVACYFFEHYVASLRTTSGPSMLPTFAVSGDFALVCRLYSRGHGVKTGDLISFEHPIHRGERAIKRVIAMEGDYVLRDTPPGLNGDLDDVEGWAQEEQEQAYTNRKDQAMIKVPKGHCWAVGDNLSWSRDSRMYGPIPLALVKGRVIAIKKPGWPWQGWRSA